MKGVGPLNAGTLLRQISVRNRFQGLKRLLIVNLNMSLPFMDEKVMIYQFALEEYSRSADPLKQQIKTEITKGKSVPHSK